MLVVACLTAMVAAAQTVSPFQSGVWCGNATATSASVVVRLTAAGQRVRLQVSTSPSLAPAVFSPVATTAATAGNTVALAVTGLKPDTEYFYGVEVAGVLRTETASRGRFRTFPLGRGYIKIAFSGDSDYRHADQRAFDAIVNEKPNLFIHLGDLHYNDTNTTNVEDYRTNYDNVLNQPNASALYRSTAIAYMWDDHDFCGNDSDGTSFSVGRDAARATYKERVPHYPIASTAGGTMAQSFTIGRVRVIITDTRSASSAADAKETASKTRLGVAQKAWFKQELISARDNGFPMILWANPDPWIGTAALGDDAWPGYATERTEIANFIRDNHIVNLVAISADMHALAYDDGTNSDYATGGGGGFPILQAAALTAGGSIKGGPYTGGPLPGSQQYGILEIFDIGGPSVACRFSGKRVGEGEKLSYIFSASTAGGSGNTLVNISTLARLASGDDALVSGFVISGQVPQRVLVRAIGPTLSQFGVGDAASRPQLTVFQGDRVIASNDAWGSTEDAVTTLTDAFDRSGAFRLENATQDAAVVLMLQPGAYTVRVKSGDPKGGSVLLEVYDIP